MPRTKQKKKRIAKPAEPQTSAPPKPQKTMLEAFETVRSWANQGDKQAQMVLKKYLDDHPQLWDQFGDMAQFTEASLVNFITDGEWVTTEAIKRRMAKMREDLSGPAPTPFEKVAIERIVACWLQLKHVEMLCARVQRDLGWAKYWIKRLEQAHKGYDAALKSLALVRSMLPATIPNVEAETTNERTDKPAEQEHCNDHAQLDFSPKDMAADRYGVNQITSWLNGQENPANGFLGFYGHESIPDPGTSGHFNSSWEPATVG